MEERILQYANARASERDAPTMTSQERQLTPNPASSCTVQTSGTLSVYAGD